MELSDRGFAAYVSLSTLTTDTFLIAIRCRHTAEPINPAPPVTKIFIEDFLFEMIGESTKDWQGSCPFPTKLPYWSQLANGCPALDPASEPRGHGRQNRRRRLYKKSLCSLLACRNHERNPLARITVLRRRHLVQHRHACRKLQTSDVDQRPRQRFFPAAPVPTSLVETEESENAGHASFQRRLKTTDCPEQNH